MTLSEWYLTLRSTCTAGGLKVKFTQPSVNDALPLLHVNVHTDSDNSTKIDTLNQVSQQIDLYCENTISVIEFEMLVNKVKNSISKTIRWDSLTTQTMVDTSTGRDIRRAMFLVTFTI